VANGGDLRDRHRVSSLLLRRAARIRRHPRRALVSNAWLDGSPRAGPTPAYDRGQARGAADACSRATSRSGTVTRLRSRDGRPTAVTRAREGAGASPRVSGRDPVRVSDARASSAAGAPPPRRRRLRAWEAALSGGRRCSHPSPRSAAARRRWRQRHPDLARWFLGMLCLTYVATPIGIVVAACLPRSRCVRVVVFATLTSLPARPAAHGGVRWSVPSRSKEVVPRGRWRRAGSGHSS
jgi:hypothetical protein